MRYECTIYYNELKITSEKSLILDVRDFFVTIPKVNKIPESVKGGYVNIKNAIADPVKFLKELEKIWGGRADFREVWSPRVDFPDVRIPQIIFYRCGNVWVLWDVFTDAQLDPAFAKKFIIKGLKASYEHR